MSLVALRSLWEETSHEIEKLQSNASCACDEFKLLSKRVGPSYNISKHLLSIAMLPVDPG